MKEDWMDKGDGQQRLAKGRLSEEAQAWRTSEPVEGEGGTDGQRHGWRAKVRADLVRRRTLMRYQREKGEVYGGEWVDGTAKWDR